METSLEIIPPTKVQVKRVMSTDGPDEIAAKLEACTAMMEWVKDVVKQVEESAMERLKELGPVRVGETIYWVGVEKKSPKCQNVPLALEKIMEACEGDFDRVCQHLSANAIKYGSAKNTLSDEDYNSLFKVEEEEKLMSDDATKAMKKLMKAPAHIVGPKLKGKAA